MKIGIGNDHAAVEMKMQIKEFIESMGHEVVNYGVDTTESCNYPEIGERVGRAVADKEVDCAVLICGTGVGISIAANKVNGVRAAVCSDVTTAHLVKNTMMQISLLLVHVLSVWNWQKILFVLTLRQSS